MPTSEADRASKHSFYKTLTDPSEVSRFKVRLEYPQRESMNTEEEVSITFHLYTRRRRRGGTKLSEPIRARHKSAALDFCEWLTGARYPTDSIPVELSKSMISQAERFETAPTEGNPSCRMWARAIYENLDTKEREFKLVVGDASVTADDPPLT
jgi:hypothetical protein